MQETIAHGALTMTMGLMLSLPRLSMGRHIGPGDVAAVGAFESVALRRRSCAPPGLPDDTCDQHHALALSRGGAIHGCVLYKEGTPVCYTEDVGRHNAVDKIAGWIYRHGVDPADKILYTRDG
jgi:hypothetical protein